MWKQRAPPNFEGGNAHPSHGYLPRVWWYDKKHNWFLKFRLLHQYTYSIFLLHLLSIAFSLGLLFIASSLHSTYLLFIISSLHCTYLLFIASSPHCIFSSSHILFIVSSLHCDDILGVAWVYWIIYSRGVVQYIQRREAPRDILLNPEGVYSPIYPCHAYYITVRPWDARFLGNWKARATQNRVL